LSVDFFGVSVSNLEEKSTFPKSASSFDLVVALGLFSPGGFNLANSASKSSNEGALIAGACGTIGVCFGVADEGNRLLNGSKLLLLVVAFACSSEGAATELGAVLLSDGVDMDLGEAVILPAKKGSEKDVSAFEFEVVDDCSAILEKGSSHFDPDEILFSLLYTTFVGVMDVAPAVFAFKLELYAIGMG